MPPSKSHSPASTHVMLLVHGPEERLEVYFNYKAAQDVLVSLNASFQKYFSAWKSKQGPGVLRFKCPNFGLEDEVRLLDMFSELGFDLITNTTNNHQTKLVFKRGFQMHQELPVLYKAITASREDHEPEH